MKKHLCIVGYAESKKLAPYNDPEVEIFGLNDLYKFIPRYDRWMQLHTPKEIDLTHTGNPEARDSWEQQKEAFKQMCCPVYMQEADPEIPNSVKYPLGEVIDCFKDCFSDPDHAKYFTNSISYMIALGIYEGFEKISVYGVDMAVNTEYGSQRPSCEFWLGMAAGRGIQIHIPNEAHLLKARYMYAYEEEKQRAYETRMRSLIEDLRNKRNMTIQQQKQLRENELTFAGAEQAVQELLDSYL